jgi:hypothetical protein
VTSHFYEPITKVDDWAARNIKDTNSYDSNNDMINSIHVRFESHQVIIFYNTIFYIKDTIVDDFNMGKLSLNTLLFEIKRRTDVIFLVIS